MTSRLIRSGPPDLLFNSTPGQSGVFQPPGPLHQVTQVAAHGKRAGPSVGFYHSAGRQPANSTPRPAGGYLSEGVECLGLEFGVEEGGLELVTEADLEVGNVEGEVLTGWAEVIDLLDGSDVFDLEESESNVPFGSISFNSFSISGNFLRMSAVRILHVWQTSFFGAVTSAYLTGNENGAWSALRCLMSCRASGKLKFLVYF